MNELNRLQIWLTAPVAAALRRAADRLGVPPERVARQWIAEKALGENVDPGPSESVERSSGVRRSRPIGD